MHGTVETILKHSLETTGFESPVLGGEHKDDDTRGIGHVIVAKVLVTDDGSVTKTNADMADVDDTALSLIVDEVMGDSDQRGTLPSQHLAWDSAETSEGTVIVIADTTAIDNSIKTQAVNGAALLLVLMLMVSVAAWELSTWALQPVEKSWEQQRRFVADASHELKTPLAVILANIQILRKHGAGADDESRRWIESTAEEAERMRKLVEDLLELARSEDAISRAAHRKMDPVDLSDLIEGICLQYDAVAFEKGCSITSEIAPSQRVKGDETELDRLFNTLFDNATKYAGTGSEITCSLSREGKQTRFRITNRGNPIPPEDLPHVFERFYRSDKARTADKTASFGLGLAIAKSIAEAHDGTIVATSDKARGTTFTVGIPAAS